MGEKPISEILHIHTGHVTEPGTAEMVE